ncbi:aminotransferase class III-fold pyridoxal phosphate-dependent enzyme [Streptomyces achromogenes]|uniref:aminotransferase class III-fold pyridoxal phosphate-dependent enzyme n=1 Tax=Streptomyces achromogenes TaxID=67255 RepID=UPI0036930A76
MIDQLCYPVGGAKAVHGEGGHLCGADGRGYIDCASAAFSLGHSRPTVLAAMPQQAEPARLTSSFQGAPVDGSLRRLVDTSPANLTEVLPKVSGGSPADGCAIRTAPHTTGRTEVIALFHGRRTTSTRSPTEPS